MRHKKENFFDKGYLGEMHVLYKLATLNIKAISLPNMFEYNLLTENDIRIEIKTSSIVLDRDKRKENYCREIWQFQNNSRITTYSGNNSSTYEIKKRDRNCDFFAFVCLNEENGVETVYVVPKEIIGKMQIITIPKIPKTKRVKLREYKEKWNLIVDEESTRKKLIKN